VLATYHGRSASRAMEWPVPRPTRAGDDARAVAPRCDGDDGKQPAASCSASWRRPHWRC
jgi:hypothetical protein